MDGETPTQGRAAGGTLSDKKQNINQKTMKEEYYFETSSAPSGVESEIALGRKSAKLKVLILIFFPLFSIQFRLNSPTLSRSLPSSFFSDLEDGVSF